MTQRPSYPPIHDFDDADDASNVRRITTTPSRVRTVPRSDVRPLRNARRQPPRRGAGWRTWLVSGALGVAALSGVWVGLQLAFPPHERQVIQEPATTPVEPAQVGAPEPPAVAVALAPTSVAPPQPTVAPETERLPGIGTVTVAATTPGDDRGQMAPKPGDPDSQAAPRSGVGQQAVAAEKPRETSEQVASAPPSASEARPAETPAEGQPPAQSVAAPSQPTQAPEVGPGTPAPIPPPEQPIAQAAAQSAAPPQAAPPAQPAAPKPAAPAPAAPPAAQTGGGAFAVTASASPANPLSENAVVTISVRATNNGAPLAGAFCMATVYYRTATVKQPSGGFTTGANGVGSFVLDAKGTTYGYTVPIDVTCSGRGGSTSARTSFTPTRGR